MLLLTSFQFLADSNVFLHFLPVIHLIELAPFVLALLHVLMIADVLSLHQLLIQPEQFRYAFAFGQIDSEIQNRGISVFILSSIGFPQQRAE